MKEDDFQKMFLAMLQKPEIVDRLRTVLKAGKEKEKQELQQLSLQLEEYEKTIASLEEKLSSKKAKYKECCDANARLSSALEDEKKKTAAAESRLEQVKDEFERLSVLLQEKNQIIERLKQDNQCLDKQYEDIKLKTLPIKQKLAEYEADFQELKNYYALFTGLDESLQAELANVIKADSSAVFLASGVQWDNIEPLWDFISYKLNCCSAAELKALKQLFSYFFACYGKINGWYERLEVNIGDELDEDLHTRASDSAVSGKISEVLLLGYRNIRTNKIIKKSIVRV